MTQESIREMLAWMRAFANMGEWGTGREGEIL